LNLFATEVLSILTLSRISERVKNVV